jgi:hypothetical protein
MDAKINGARRNTVKNNGGGNGSSRMKNRESTAKALLFWLFCFCLCLVAVFCGWVDFELAGGYKCVKFPRQRGCSSAT